MKDTVKQILKQYGSDRNRLMDILIDIQEQLGYIPKDAIDLLAANLGMSQVDVEQTISFYHFFSTKPRGKYAIYLNDSAVARMFGYDSVKRTLRVKPVLSLVR